MKKINGIKLAILSFAVFGLFMVGSNVYSSDNMTIGKKPARLSCSGTHDGLGNGYRYCPTCEWVANAHPDSWTAGTCSN